MKCEAPLCPGCVEFITTRPLSGRSQSKVVFLCGHAFHDGCASKWFRENSRLPGRCPICESGSSCAAAVGAACDAAAGDAARTFLLASLQRRYPEIITEACAQRWKTCHIETWLMELTCPAYTPLLARCF
mmetsp:Transcript_28011/g.60805  ORF Transcript_28011/g.60805 Transcript_28011/m.60805 type:complete len:130 (-) Transcript_28011:83-472(-)